MARRPLARDLALAGALGGASAFIWASAMGLFSAYAQLPFLVWLSRQIGKAFHPWIHAYMLVSEAVGAAIVALVVALPLGMYVRSRIDLLWLLFGVAYFGALMLPLYLDGWDASTSWFLLSLPGPWLYLLGSLLFMVCGRSLRRRNAA